MPEINVDWIWLYAGIGLISFPVLRALVYIFHRKESPTAWAQEVKAALEKERSNSEQVKKILAWIGMLVVVTLIWPVTTLIAIYALFFDKQSNPRYNSDEDDFSCKKKDLVQLVNALQIESASYVTDPLGRVPNVPFGHLHKGWINFLAQLEATDELWSFKTKGWASDSPNSPKYSRPRNVSSGFAIVRNKKIVAEFVCGWD